MSGYLGGPGIGVGFTPGAADTVSTSTPEFPGAPMRVGTVFTASDGSQWVYVLAAGAITANDFVIVTTNSTWAVQAMSNTLAASKLGQLVGVAGATATSGQYLWMQVSGYRASVSAVTGMTGFTAARTTATAGRIDDTITGGTTVAITGAIILATAASNVAAALLNNPTVGAND